jgi:hypothetical protein
MRLVTVLGMFFGGAGVGLLLAEWLAPSAAIASLVSFLMLPAAMIAGFHAWLGAAILLSVPRLARRLIDPSGRTTEDCLVPPGAWAFLPIGSGAGGLGGLLTGLLSPASVLVTVPIYWLAGTAYGFGLWRLARSGHLPFPDPE